MPDDHKAEIFIADQQESIFLKEFALLHHIQTLNELLTLPLCEMWQMEGFTMHAQNEIIELVRRYNLEGELREV